mmetsp:Transcript_84906/g.245313  ORF Transcript_84906/g.245313 Transcript_84906/m.245313 type:complete len:154 (-) Transcript_84906:308-769(-)
MVSLGSQFSAGDQGGGKEAFWRSGFKDCQGASCRGRDRGASTVASESHTAGCRMNGDAYGTTVYTCTACGWSTSFQWDDASDTHFYETEGWSREKPKAEPHPWCGVNVWTCLQGACVAPDIIAKLGLRLGRADGGGDGGQAVDRPRLDQSRSR